MESFEKQKELLFKKLDESKNMLEQFKKNYPDSPEYILRLETQILDLESQINKFYFNTPDILCEANTAEIDWTTVQKNYTEYCKTFSPAYLSGCSWYQIIGDDFKSGYLKMQYQNNSTVIQDGLTAVFLSNLSF